VDLPDPSHPDLNKLYSTYFYNRLRHLLSGDGVLAVQSTSPFHARKAFISVGKTLEEAGFKSVEQYRQNVPTFGEWGWTLGTKRGQPVSRRLEQVTQLNIPDPYVTLGLMQAAFEFPAGFYNASETIKANHLGSGVIYQYHREAWARDEGAVFFEPSQHPQNSSPKKEF
jgi:spermidine synthase